MDYDKDVKNKTTTSGGIDMKKRITITKTDEKLHFYLVTERSRSYLFTQGFSKGVYDYFRRGRSERELHEYKQWNKNPRLDKTIEKIPMYTQYVLREVA